MDNIRIAIADDQHLFRQSLAALIRSIQGFDLVAEAANGASLLSVLTERPPAPDIALIDMDMPGINGLELNTRLQQDFPDIRTIALSVHAQERFVVKMIDTGASGYLVKNCDIEELVNAIRTVYKSGFYLNDHVLRSIRNAARYRNTTIRNVNQIPVALTGRETEILLMICREYSNAGIAQELFLSIRTVEGHRNNLLAKTGCRNTAGLVLFALRNGLFDMGF